MQQLIKIKQTRNNNTQTSSSFEEPLKWFSEHDPELNSPIMLL
jgi:inhibitor of KinA sporulation pathway (predicted exonuclease)